jgi:hypothetical protein
VPPPDFVQMTASERRLLAALTAAALIIRVLAAWRFSWYNTDTLAYFDMATAIADGRPMSYFPNGYPLLILAVRSMVGEAHAPGVLVGVNVLAGTLAVPVVALIGARCFSARAGLIAAALLAAWPNQINYTRQILTEAPATALIVLAVAALLTRRDLAAGVLAYASVLLRTTLLPAAAVFAFWTWRVHGRPAAARYLLGLAIVAGGEWALIGAGIVAPPANLGGNFLLATRAPDDRGRDFSLAAFDEAARANPVRTYLSFAVEEPAAFIALRLRSLWELWGPWPDAGAPSNPRSPAARAAIGARFLVAAIAGLVRHRSRHAWLLAIPVLTLTALHIVFFSMPRFTFTVEPFALLLASAAWLPRAAGDRRVTYS